MTAASHAGADTKTLDPQRDDTSQEHLEQLLQAGNQIRFDLADLSLAPKGNGCAQVLIWGSPYASGPISEVVAWVRSIVVDGGTLNWRTGDVIPQNQGGGAE